MSDASVAYDAAHGVWIVSSIPLLPNTSVPTVFINRSTDDGRTWGRPISMPPPVSNSVDLDKNWTACDNHPSSPFYGHCYTELDKGPMTGDYISTSFSGGQATTVFPVGRDATTAAFDEAMYSPGRLSVATAAQATHVGSSAGSFGAVGTGETHALKND